MTTFHIILTVGVVVAVTALVMFLPWDKINRWFKNRMEPATGDPKTSAPPPAKRKNHQVLTKSGHRKRSK